MNKWFKRIWKDQVWSNVIAGVILGLGGIIWVSPAVRRLLAAIGSATWAAFVLAGIWIARIAPLLGLVLFGAVIGAAVMYRPAYRRGAENAIGKRAKEIVNAVASRPGLSDREMSVVMMLVKADGSPISVDGIQEVLGLGNLEVSLLLDQLRARRLVETYQHPVFGDLMGAYEPVKLVFSHEGRQFVARNGLLR
jgi:hypothetical protein